MSRVREFFRRHGKRIRQFAWPAFILLLLVMLGRHLLTVEWREVWQAVKSTPIWLLAVLGIGGLIGHGVYGCLDLIGRRWTGHRLSARRTWLLATSSYAFNLNLGALVGGIGLRYRLYHRQGVSSRITSRIIATSVTGNWLGYLALLGVALATLGGGALRRWTGDVGIWLLAVACLAAVGLYLLASWRGWRLRVRGRTLHLPPPRLALAQLGISVTSWLIASLLLWGSLGGQTGYPETLQALLLAAIAGAVTHVPGGLGVLEFVVLASLAGSTSQNQLLAGVLVYRLAYYLVPLAFAGVGYVLLERRASRDAAGADAAVAPAVNRR